MPPSHSASAISIPDESGMGYDEIPLGTPHWDPDSHRWMVQLNRFQARPATDDEIVELARTTPSEGEGWTLDMMQPYFRGIPCSGCGKFVWRDGSIEVEHFEMSSEIASIDGTCVRCLRAR